MSEDLLETINGLKGRWMIGGSALDKASSPWREIAESDASPDSALLALAGQAMQVGMRTIPGVDLKPLRPLPRLSLPTPPLQARQQFQAAIRVGKLPEPQIK
ncbi:MAG: hypothetical protein AAF664_19915, partial [Planctomycetota bacterium]